ncbi:MAG TPA: Gfo/Idh/MocA family oxidoreductase, partial [Gemmatimonadales bacterium]
MGKGDLRFGIVGCGRIAVRHADLLASGAINGARLAAVCDSVPARAEAFAAKHRVPAFSSIEALLQASALELDAISILTPSGLHAEHVIQVAPHVRNIVVEKPMALTLDDADAMIRACDANNTRLFVVKQNRFNVPVRKLREALEAGRFGQLVLGTVRVRWCRPQSYYDQDAWRGTWALDGGVLANQASHHVDLLEWMMGDVASVFARASTALAKIETEDTAAVVLKFRNGALGLIEATTATRPRDLEGSLSMLGAGGTVEIGGFAVNQMKVWDFVEKAPGDEEVLTKYSVNPPNVYGFGHQAYYEHVVDCIVNNRKQLVDGLEGRRSLELITAIYESV